MCSKGTNIRGWSNRYKYRVEGRSTYDVRGEQWWVKYRNQSHLIGKIDNLGVTLSKEYSTTSAYDFCIDVEEEFNQIGDLIGKDTTLDL